jgi:hypothetical protein
VPVAETAKLLISDILSPLWLSRGSKKVLEALLSEGAAGCNHDAKLACTLQVILLELIKYIENITCQIKVNRIPNYIS